MSSETNYGKIVAGEAVEATAADLEMCEFPSDELAKIKRKRHPPSTDRGTRNKIVPSRPSSSYNVQIKQGAESDSKTERLAIQDALGAYL